MKLPAFQFYPGDWIQDPIAGCSLGAQGLWLRLLFLMHNSPRYGYLVLDSAPAPEDWVCRQVGSYPSEYRSLLAELTSAGIPSLTKSGILYSRRLVRDAEKRAASCGYVAKSRKLKENCKINVRSPSDPSSSSSSSSEEEPPIVPKIFCLSPPEGGGKDAPKISWKDEKAALFWSCVWAKIGKDAALKAFKRKIRSPAEADEIIAAAKTQGPRLLQEAAQRRDGGVLHPATWLNQGRWADELPLNGIGPQSDPRWAEVQRILAEKSERRNGR